MTATDAKALAAEIMDEIAVVRRVAWVNPVTLPPLMERIEALLAPHLRTPDDARRDDLYDKALAVSTMERQCREDHMSMDEAGALGDRLDAARNELNAAVVALGMVGR